ncbi:putative DNA helicase [Aspergillus clavatus NRRL 1]|uniref:DNA helicase, putative n=1 Tax=Aspergillus clavatus (strain ATCC 1007 / CBS 513.65 / DSM 816 / NCTC 3887 / NRRL 1 / QM 1276 / 107) TaxID=344612 RepID=A1CFU1_ASPCL|nr:DNA helicase, putative [Aspergillus clavatus NRRL 1]EAW11740.1 DNA helicase, putative [Aspergillus clavatus NRRL 1]
MAPSAPILIPHFAQAQLQLLLQEHEAEISSSVLASTAASVSPSTRRTLQATGYALTGIVLSQCRTGLGGRVVGEFAADAAVSSKSKGGDGNTDRGSSDGEPRLGAHGIRVGDIVRVNDISGSGSKKSAKDKGKGGGKDTADESKGPEGVVTRVGERSIWIAFGQRGGGGRSKEDDEAIEELWGKKLWLIKLANDVTYRRMNQTMEKMSKMTDSDYTHFMRVAFGHTTPMQPGYDAIGPIEITDPTLNDSQKEAIRFALASRDVALIHGPPGTGKTHTLIELIIQMVKRKLRVLVCGPSNISVDNIVERLALKKVPIVRIGHPARLLPSVLEHSLEVLTHTSEAAAIVKDVRKEIDEKQASIRKTKSGRERRAIYGDLKELRREYRDRESKCVDNLVRESSVVLATLHGAGGHQLKNQKFDVVVIDEASQALEAQCWISLLSASKVVLAGDHLQLPPTVKSTVQKSKSAKTKGQSNTKSGSTDASDADIIGGVSLETTMFDRLLALHGPGIKRMLTTQYRMHEKIMQFPSDELYESRLIAADSVKLRLLKDLPYEVEETDDTKEPLVFWDTQGGDFPEKTEDDEIGKKEALLGESKSNEMEALVVVKHVDNLIQSGVRPEDIACITPYNGQLALLSSMLREKYPGLELGSVDGFQGREKEAVVVSLVRSNPENEVGFLGEKRRLNVAMTRPKRHLCICGDAETISKSVNSVHCHSLENVEPRKTNADKKPLMYRGSPFLKRWMGFLEEHADLRYPDAAEVL